MKAKLAAGSPAVHADRRASLAEGNGRFMKAYRGTFFGIVRGCVQKCVSLLEVAHRRGLLDEPHYTWPGADLEEIARMLSGFINGLNGQGRSR